MRILFLGDIFGHPGRQAVRQWLPDYRRKNGVDFVIANHENAAGGKGITEAIAHELLDKGIDVLTGGNHSLHHREAWPMFDHEARVLRPANWAPGAPGRGMGFYETDDGRTVAVINLQGRAFMKPIDCPFRAAAALVDEALKVTSFIVVDFHAEATSEKMAMAAYLDGRVTAVIGTHTHVPTSDARLLRGGTAAVTDVGMCGPFDSVIGVETSLVLEQFIKGLPVRHQPAKDDVRICGLEVETNDAGRAIGVRLVQTPPWRTQNA